MRKWQWGQGSSRGKDREGGQDDHRVGGTEQTNKYIKDSGNKFKILENKKARQFLEGLDL